MAPTRKKIKKVTKTNSKPVSDHCLVPGDDFPSISSLEPKCKKITSRKVVDSASSEGTNRLSKKKIHVKSRPRHNLPGMFTVTLLISENFQHCTSRTPFF